MKEHKAILALLGIGALLMLVYLMRRHSAAGSVEAGAAGGPQEYPNSDPLGAINFQVGGTPLNLSYNTLPGGGLLPTVAVGGGVSNCPCNDDPCATAQTLTTLNTVPQSALDSAAANYAGYQEKLISLLATAPGETIAA